MQTKKLKKYEAWTEVLKAIANPVRLFIIEELERGEKCVNDFNELLNIDISTISRHLTTLKKAGVNLTKEKVEKYFSIQSLSIISKWGCRKL